MKRITGIPFALMLCAALFAGCASFEATNYSGDFVRTTDVSSLDTFSYRHTMVSGMVVRNSSQELVMKELSQKVLTQQLASRGFEAVNEDGDLYVVSKWRKEINMNAAEAVRYSLIVELYEAATDEVFWRAELPYVFNAMQWSEVRIEQTLSMAIQDFPSRVEKDPNLPNVQ
ncbi:MAG: hypothetical protein ACI8Z5_000442 [Lentimonas sp.]|jgi:hypothetical protein